MQIFRLVKKTAEAILWVHTDGKKVWGKYILISNYEVMTDLGYGNLFHSMMWRSGLPENPNEINIDDEYPFEVPNPAHTDSHSNPAEFESFSNNPGAFTELLISGIAELNMSGIAGPSMSGRRSTSVRPSIPLEPSTPAERVPSMEQSTLPPRTRRPPNWWSPSLIRRKRK